MGKIRNRESEPGTGIIVRFSLAGFVMFSVALVLAGGVLTSGLMTVHARNTSAGDKPLVAVQVGDNTASAKHDVGPWGDLVTRDIEVERPEEYAAYEMGTNQAPKWVFEKMSPEKARALMVACGLTPEQVDRALSPGRCLVNSTGTVVEPDEELVFSLTPETRGKLYGKLALSAANHYMQFPFCFPEQKPQDWFEDGKLDPALVERIKKLFYQRGSVTCFSDFELIMRGVGSENERLALVKALSRQPALLAGLHIGPETDIDRLLGYWGRGLQVKDARPLLESIKRLDGGGNISLLYMLPRFARERLYTFPLPPKANDPAMDCHWSTMNFFNETPDDRFANPAYTVQYLTTNFYRVAKPSLYGDIVLVLNDEGNAIHSAVYLADDVVFTKNGNNYAQPWMLMRLKDVLGDYSGEAPGHIAVFRNKSS